MLVMDYRMVDILNAYQLEPGDLIGLGIIGIVKVISNFFEPIVQLMGLPAEFGIIWVTAIIVNVYAAIILFINILPTLDLTVAQVTVLTLIILIAHNILIESAISRAAGVSFFYASFLRIGIAFLAGFILNKIYFFQNI